MQFTSFSAMVAEVRRDLKVTAEQHLLRSASTALTRTAIKVREDLKVDMARVFDRPTPYALNGLRAVPSTDKTLTSKVALKDFGGKNGIPAVKFLGPEITGSARHLKRFERALQAKGILPSWMYAEASTQADLDQYGNLRGSEIVEMLSALGAFMEGGYLANRTLRSSRHRAKIKKAKPQTKYFVTRDRWTKEPLGIWKVVSKGHVKPVVVFSRRPAYKARFHFQELAGQHAKEHFETELFRALQEGVKNA